MKISIGTYEATIYSEGDGFTGAISLGFDTKGRRRRVKRKGKTRRRSRTSSAKSLTIWKQACGPKPGIR
jgi:hypothetical protein